MTVENLPAVREPASSSLVRRDTDSWAEMLPAVVDLARSICGTDFVPQALRGNIPATAAAMLYGREIGLPPMTALGNVNVIKGRPGLSAVIMRAQVLAAGHELREDDCTHARCVLSGKRRGTDYWQTVEYTFEDAKRAGLLSQNANYEKNPRRMLRARATSELCELMFADVVRGMSSFEELEEIDDDAPAGVAGALPPARGTSKVQRKARTSKSGAGASSAPGGDGAAPADSPRTAGSNPPAPSSPPPLPGEPGYDGEPSGTADAQDGAEQLPEPEQVSPGRPASKAILRAIMGQFRQIGFGDTDVDRAARLEVAEAIIGRPVTTMGQDTDLTHEEARQLAAAITAVDTRAQLFQVLAEAAQGDEEAGQ